MKKLILSLYAAVTLFTSCEKTETAQPVPAPVQTPTSYVMQLVEYRELDSTLNETLVYNLRNELSQVYVRKDLNTDTVQSVMINWYNARMDCKTVNYLDSLFFFPSVTPAVWGVDPFLGAIITTAQNPDLNSPVRFKVGYWLTVPDTFQICN